MRVVTFISAACCSISQIAAAGGQCLIFTRPTDTVRIAGNTEGSDSYTMEWAGYLLAKPLTVGPASDWGMASTRVWSEQNSVTEDKGLGFSVESKASGWANNPCFVPIQNPTPIAVSQRVHIALVHNQGVQRLYVDGRQVASSAECSIFSGGGSNMSLGAFVYIGQPSSNYWAAAPVAIDWLRVSSSVRYSSDFVPPREASIESDTSTELLLKFDGQTPWTDLSGNCTLYPGQGVSGGTVPTLSTDCNGNEIPDEVELLSAGADSNSDGVLDACQCSANPQLPDCCPGDLNGDGQIDGADISVILAFWGPNPVFPAADTNRDGAVNGADLAEVLTNWGTCPR
jgi:hypothetical protein